ncbi:MAG: hypothetical protein K2H52_13645 [Lachnospiraceae bacterium]|nr:hypothetical protein [Lachnospiraceae bacterium]
MRFLNQANGQSKNDILLLMTYKEACEIRDDLEKLISSEKLNDHSHISDAEFKHEITLSIYNENDLNGYQDHIKKLILEEK